MEDDIGIERRMPQNILRSIPRVPLCDEGKEGRRVFEERSDVPPLTSEYTCTA